MLDPQELEKRIGDMMDVAKVRLYPLYRCEPSVCLSLKKKSLK